MDIGLAGQRVRHGSPLWRLGVDLAKGEIYGWLRLKPHLFARWRDDSRS